MSSFKYVGCMVSDVMVAVLAVVQVMMTVFDDGAVGHGDRRIVVVAMMIVVAVMVIKELLSQSLVAFFGSVTCLVSSYNGSCSMDSGGSIYGIAMVVA